MEDGLAIVPLNGGEGYTYLSRSRQGKLFKKHILSKGPLHYPGVGGTVDLDDDFFAKLTKNFNDRVCDIVQVPVADKNNNHSEDPRDNIGEVIGLSYENDKLYATIDARDEKAASGLGKTLLGASAMMHLNYTDTRTNKKVGPTLLHVAVTNRPFVVNLDEYSEIDEVVAASVDGKGEAVILTASQDSSKENNMPTLDELIAVLKTDHNIDVSDLQTRAARADEGVALSNKLAETLGDGVLKLSNGETASADEIVKAVADIHTTNVELSAKVDSLIETGAKHSAETRVDSLIGEGRILPKDKDAQVALLLSNSEIFESLLPEKPIVKLSHSEEDASGFDAQGDKHDETVASEIARLSNSDAAAPYIRPSK